MKAILLLCLIFISTFSTVIPHVGPVKRHTPRTYKVSLDDGPYDRWKHIVTDYHEPLKKLMDYFDMLDIPDTFFDGV